MRYVDLACASVFPKVAHRFDCIRTIDRNRLAASDRIRHRSAMTDQISALAEVDPAAGELLQRIVDEHHTRAAPFVPDGVRVRRLCDHLAAFGLLVDGEAVENMPASFYPSPAAPEWLDENGPAALAAFAAAEAQATVAAEATRDPPPVIAADLLARARALVVEITTGGTPTTLDDVVSAVLRKGFDVFDRERAASAPQVALTRHATANAVEIRRVGGLLVWADVVKAIGAANGKSLADTYKVPLLPLPPSTINAGRPGRAPSTGIDPRELDRLSTRYRLEVAAIREAIAEPVEPAAAEPAAPPEAESGVYQIRNTVTGSVFIGAASSFKAHWHKHTHRLRRGDHSCARLQKAWNTYGEAAFVLEVLRPVDATALASTLPIVVEQVVTTWGDRPGVVYNYGQVLKRRGRKPGSVPAKGPDGRNRKNVDAAALENAM